MKKRVFVRKLPAIFAAAGLLVVLSACASTPAPFADCAPGSSAALVKADGSFPTPLVSDGLEQSVVSAGDGDQVRSTDAVVLDLTIFDAETGEQVQDSLTLPSFVTGLYPFTSAMTCATVGAKVATTGTVTELLNPETPSDQQIVIVSEITDAFPAQATGSDQILQSGFPGVVFTSIGQPGFTFTGDAPTTLNIAAFKQGSGETVKQGDAVIANITGVVWGASDVFASSWTNLAPGTLTASKLDADGNGVVGGLAKALIGQQVGSRVIAVVPPGDDSYPAAQLPEGVTETDTLVFVVDILAIG